MKLTTVSDVICRIRAEKYFSAETTKSVGIGDAKNKLKKQDDKNEPV
jgi:hypothetical protein